MPQVSPHLRLTPLNPAWTWDRNREGIFQLSLRKDGWLIRVIGTASDRYDQAVFEADPARYAIETGRSNQLKAIGRSLLLRAGVRPAHAGTRLALHHADLPA